MRARLVRALNRHRGVLLLMVVAALLPGLGVLGLYEPLREAAAGMRAGGAWWWPAFVIVAAAACGLALLPTHAVSLAAGFVFGPVLGSAAALAAVVGGTAIGWRVSRLAVGRRLREGIDRTRPGRAIAAAMIDARGWRAVLAVTLVRLPPQLPFAMGTVLASASGVRLGPLLLGTALGMLPRVAIVAWLGSELARLHADRDPRLFIGGLAIAIVSLTILGAWSWRILKRAARQAT